jgi:hypothetical protein
MSSDGVPAGEADLLLRALLRLKRHRFGRLTVTVHDGRIVDVEVTEKLDREALRALGDREDRTR